MKRLFLLIIVFGCIGTANAQWHFTITSMSYNDVCGGNAIPTYGELEVRIQKQLAIQSASKTYSSKEECEIHKSIATMNSSNGGCYIRTTTSPCTGSIISGASGPADILAPSQGYSFYSTNPANEVRNWSSDDIERHLALNQQYHTNTQEAINTNDAKFNEERAEARENNTWYVDPDKPFVSVNLREEGSSRIHIEDFSLRESIDKALDYTFLANQANVQRYVNASTISAKSYFDNPQDLTQWLHHKFRIVSGFDVDAIMQKLPSERTKAEKQALIDYQEFRKQVTDLMINDINQKANEVSKELDMAIISEDSYTYSEHIYINQTNYRKITSDFFEDGSTMKNLSNIIELCNLTNAITGFHADLYYNDITNEYTVAFEGSNVEFKQSTFDALSSASMKPLMDIVSDWAETNLVQALGGIPPQYVLAAIIGQNMPNDIKINITGHSLGGGLASLAGIISGKPTYTFNAEGVNKNITTAFNINDKIEHQDYNIQAIQSKDDPLTSAQEGEIKIGATIIVESIIPGLAVMRQISPQLSEELYSNYIGAPTVGRKKQYETGKGHSIDGFIKQLSFAQKTYSIIKKDLYEHGHSVEHQTQDSILIKLFD